MESVSCCQEGRQVARFLDLPPHFDITKGQRDKLNFDFFLLGREGQQKGKDIIDTLLWWISIAIVCNWTLVVASSGMDRGR